MLGKQLESSGVLNEAHRSRSNSWGLHMPLVCPDGVVVAYTLQQLTVASGSDKFRPVNVRRFVSSYMSVVSFQDLCLLRSVLYFLLFFFIFLFSLFVLYFCFVFFVLFTLFY